VDYACRQLGQHIEPAGNPVRETLPDL